MGESLRRELREIHQNTGIRVTLIEPGGVDTPFFDQPREGRLHADDVARTVLWAISQPAHVDIGEVLVLSQEGDPLHPAQVGRDLAAMLPKARLVVFDRPGVALREGPRLRTLITGFLNDGGGS